MERSTKYIIGIAIVMILAVSFIIYNSYRQEQVHFNKVELSHQNHIINRTDLPYLDTIVSVGLDELDVVGITVMITPVTFDVSRFEREYKLSAFTLEGYANSQYLIQIRSSDKQSIIETISHELIHIKQLNLDILKTEDTYVIWYNDTIYSDDMVEYLLRPWETNAFEDGEILENKITNKLYK